jgi:hypothetical protein
VSFFFWQGTRNAHFKKVFGQADYFCALGALRGLGNQEMNVFGVLVVFATYLAATKNESCLV